MNISTSVTDLRTYRPAGVVVIDLVKHSSRDKAAVHAVQTSMTEVLERAWKLAKIEEISFNYTGDGYVCALVGDSSARLMDFLNAVVPALKKQLSRHNQQMRVGVDFGLVHLRRNSLTGKAEYFDLPSVQAARLEHEANPGQILCTETVRFIFGQHYPGMFSAERLSVTTKDREINAYEISPIDTQEQTRAYLTEFFLGSPGERESKRDENRTKFLVVDDEEAIRETISTMLSARWPELSVYTASNGREALNLFRTGEFAVVFTDLIMPVMDGMKLTSVLAELDCDLPIVVVTAVHDDETTKHFFTAGGSYALIKPFEKEWCCDLTTIALNNRSAQAIRAGLSLLCDDIGSFLLSLHNAAMRFRVVLRDSGRVGDRAAALLRHQAKQAVSYFVSRVGPGCDLLGLTAHLEGQLACITRLMKNVANLKGTNLEKYLSDVVSDFQTLNPEVHFAFEYAGSDRTLEPISNPDILVLVVSELVDNALCVLGDQGKIGISICFLRASKSIQLMVHDSGPGVPKNIEATLFDEGVTTKGARSRIGFVACTQCRPCAGRYNCI